MACQPKHKNLCASCVACLDNAHLTDRPARVHPRDPLTEFQGIGQLHSCAEDLFASAIASCFLCTLALRLCVERRLRLDDDAIHAPFEEALRNARLAHAASQRDQPFDGLSELPFPLIKCSQTPFDAFKSMCGKVEFDVCALDVSYTIFVGRSILALKVSDQHRNRLNYVELEGWSDMDDFKAPVATEIHTSGPATLELCRQWLSVCERDHKHSSTGWVPRRLLELSGDVVRVIPGEKLAKPRYATLSHCWGTRPFRALTVDTIHTFEIGLPIEEFLPSFRDAMRIAQSLHFEYVWIDCFCIIQDDPLELEEECEAMDLVYANATVNIGALDASSPCGGIYGLRTPKHMNRISFAMYRGLRLNIIQFMIDHKRPLFERAWVVQERFLSQRMLHFTDGVFWSCSEQWDSESIGHRPGHSFVNFHMGHKQHFPDMVAVLPWWAEALRHYTSAQLTYPDIDKIRAIQGVLSQFEHHANERIWYGHFLHPRCLLWSRPSWRTTRPTTRSNRTPTWSWSSMDGPLDFFDCWFPHYNPKPDEPLIFIAPSLVGSQLFCIGRVLKVEVLGRDKIVLPSKFETRSTFDNHIPSLVLAMPVLIEWSVGIIRLFMLLLEPLPGGDFRRIGNARWKGAPVWQERKRRTSPEFRAFLSRYNEEKARLILIG